MDVLIFVVVVGGLLLLVVSLPALREDKPAGCKSPALCGGGASGGMAYGTYEVHNYGPHSRTLTWPLATISMGGLALDLTWGHGPMTAFGDLGGGL